MSSTTSPEALRRIEECRTTRKPKLDLSECDLAEVPSELVDLVWMKNLNLSKNQISEIKNLDALTALTELDLSYNEISQTKGLDALTALTELDLSGNRISEIKKLGPLTALTGLNLSYNQISEIKNLDALTALTGLDLSFNQISEIKNLNTLSALTELYLSENKVSEIKNLDALTALTKLDLSFNQISEVKNLDALTALMELQISDNEISEVKNLDALTNMTELWLSGNKITSLSGLTIELLSKLEKLKFIDLSDNPIEGTTIIDWSSLKAIQGYLESQQDTLVPNYHLKVNIIGEGRIGKTQLFKYWSKQRYKANQEATHGTLTTTLDIPQSNYKATVWDFGGQAYHHGFHHVFLRPNDFYLVLWRNDPEKKPDYGYWLGTARNFSQPSKQGHLAPVALVQNVWTETDDKEESTTHQADEVVFPDSQKMEKYGVTLDDVFVIDIKQLRAKAGPWKVRHDYFRNSVYQKMIEHARKLLPEVSEKWLRIKEKLDENPIKEINLTKEAFHEQYVPEFDEAALAGLLDYLEFAGNIIKFPRPSSLSDYVFPDPPKLSAWIYGTVLNKKMLEKNNGIIKYSSIQEKIGEDKAKIFLGIMEEFNLMFTEKGNDDNLVIPQFLPENNNSFKRLILELIPYSFCLRFADFFHESRIFQFISEYGEYADDKTSYWRYGLVFTIDHVNALVYYNQEERTVFVHLENKKGRIQIAQRVFNYFTKRVIAQGNFVLTSLHSVNPGPDYEPSMEEVERSNAFLKFIGERMKRRLIPEDLIEGAQLSINREDYIDIKETLRNNTDDFPIGICVKSRKRIKLDNLTLNLLGLMTQQYPKVFISYSNKDYDFTDKLKTQLKFLESYGLLKAWSCEEIQAGTWHSQIQNELAEAEIIVYMVSSDFLASDYIMNQEIAKGIKMAEAGEAKIICVLVRDCLWDQWSFIEKMFQTSLTDGETEVSSKDLSKYQFLPYHKSKTVEGVTRERKMLALEEWGRHPNDVASVAYKQIAKQILDAATRKK